MSLVRLPAAAFGSVLLIGLSMGVLSGCPDPQATFDAFGDRYTKINAPSSGSTSGSGGGCSVPAPGALDGQWLFMLSAKINPKKAVALLMDVTTVDDGAGGLTMHMKETPLSYNDQMTSVGDQVDLGDSPIKADGTFTSSFPSITVPGGANPITKDAPITATVTLAGGICTSDPGTFICGDVTGKVTAPLMLDLGGSPSSSFTMTKIVGGVFPMPVINCAKDPATYN